MTDEEDRIAAEKSMAFHAAMYRDLILKARKLDIDDAQILDILLGCCEKQMKGYEDETFELIVKCNKMYSDLKLKEGL